MKNFTKVFALLLFFSVNFFSNAQSIQTYGTSTYNSCDGAAYYMDSTTFTSWQWINSNNQVIQTNGTSITDLCYGYYYLAASDGFLTDTMSFFIDTVNNNPCANFSVYANASSIYDSTCSGSAYAYVYGGTLPYTYLWNTGQTTATITDLCAGIYMTTVSDANGCEATVTTQVIDSSFVNNDCNGFYVSILSFDQITNPNACDGSVIVGAFGGDGNYTYNWNNGVSGTVQSGLCAGYYAVEVTDGNGCYTSTSVNMFSEDSTWSCSGFYANLLHASPASSSFLCDGTATVEVIGGSGNYVVIWDNDEGDETAVELCVGMHIVTVYDQGLGCYDSLGVYISADSLEFYDLNAYVYPYSPTSEGACDGSAYVDVFGGTSPYTFEHSTGDNTQYVSNLCAGIYSVLVTDANGDSLLLNYIVPESNNIFNGGNYEDSTLVDTLYNELIEDCIIDYMTLDTAFISNIEYISQDSIVVTWSVVDGNGTINFYQSYTISTGVGVYELILQIFCPQRSSTDYVYAIDQFYFNPALLKVDELASGNFSVYPNPFENVVKIDLEDNLNSNVTITDITGKVVYTSSFSTKHFEVDLSNVSKGQYFLTVSNEKTQKTQVIIK